MGSNLQLTQAPTAKKGMLIRRPPAEVFQAFAEPAVTTKFWFTRSSGKVVAGAKLQWDWEMFGASAKVAVKEVEENRRIVFAWGAEERPTTVELRFVPWEGHTFVQVTETGFSGTGDQMVAHAIDSTGGFSLVLAAAKALLEHGVVLTVVLDHMPKGLQLE
jgi:uncharacterized protein YndB with AHSA1/START domain